jgi:hypothetical protein
MRGRSRERFVAVGGGYARGPDEADPGSGDSRQRGARSNKRMQLTKLRAAPVRAAEVPPRAPAGEMDGGTASQLIRGVRPTSGWTPGRPRRILRLRMPACGASTS